VNPPTLSQADIDKILEDNKKNKLEKTKIINVVETYHDALNKPIHLSQPVLIVWGNKDKIFDVSGAAKLQKNFPHSTLVILKNTGHLAHVECPITTVRAYLNFLKDITNGLTTQNNKIEEMDCVGTN